MPGPSFHFRLERIRALRERKEDAAKQELAVALVEQRRYVEQLEAAAARVEQARSAQLESAAKPTSANHLVARQRYLERAERALTAIRSDLDRHEVEVTHRRDLLTEAARDRQALERLKEHRRADHEREAGRREGLELDEIAITNHRRVA